MDELGPAEFARTRDRNLGMRIESSYIVYVQRMAEHQARKPESQKFDVNELAAWGREGLHKALLLFDPAKGVAFSTFAFPKIRAAMLEGILEDDRRTL